MRSLHHLIVFDKDRKKDGFRFKRLPDRLTRLTRLSAQVHAKKDWIETLIDRVSIKSFISSRIRFFLDFTGDEVLADTLRRELQRVDTVKLESYSIRTPDRTCDVRSAKSAARCSHHRCA